MAAGWTTSATAEDFGAGLSSYYCVDVGSGCGQWMWAVDLGCARRLESRRCRLHEKAKARFVAGYQPVAMGLRPTKDDQASEAVKKSTNRGQTPFSRPATV